jgi:hypothetical protein
MREYGLDEVKWRAFPRMASAFFWAYLTEPAWDSEAEVGRDTAQAPVDADAA